MIGQTISHYRILSRLGEGGMGVVYVAEDTLLGRRVALKLPLAAGENGYRARFLREARAVSALVHPRVAAVYDCGETADGQSFIVMELVEGRTLGELLHAGELTLARAVEIVIDVADALSEAHRRGIVHRDIKPSNVMVNDRGEVKVLDFGLAKQLEEAGLASGPDAQTIVSTHTRSDVVIGTPMYLSPEQARGARVDRRSDIFALGSLLYECVAGRPAFAGANVIEIGGQVLHVNPPPPSRYNPRVPAELDRAVLKALAKKPEERYQTAEEFIADLESARAALPHADTARTKRLSATHGGATGTVRRSALLTISQTLRRPRLSPLAFAGALVLVLAGVWAYARWRAPAPHQPLPGAVAWYERGADALRDGAYDQARRALQRAVETDERYALARAALAEAWTELDYLDRANNELVALSALVPDRSALPELDALRLDAVRFTALRKFNEAAEAYRRIVELRPDEPQARVDLGRAYERTDDLRRAAESYTEAVRRAPGYATAYLRLGAVHGRQNDLPSAILALEKAENLYRAANNAEGRAEVLTQRGELFLRNGKLEEARRDLEGALASARGAGNEYQRVRAQLSLSSVLFFEQRLPEAERNAREALEAAQAGGMYSLPARAFVDLGNVYLFRGQYAEAERLFRQALDFTRHYKGRHNEARAQFALAAALIQQYRTGEAEEAARKALEYFAAAGFRKETIQCHSVLGRAARQKGDYAAALESFGQQLRVASEIGNAREAAVAHNNLGRVLALQERYPEALAHFDESYKINKRQNNKIGAGYSLLNRGSAWLRLGHFAEARAALDEAYSIADGPDGLKALLAGVLVERAELALAGRRFGEALGLAARAAATAPQDPEIVAEALRLRGVALSFSGKAREARGACEEAVRRAGEPALRARAELALAEALLEGGDARGALEAAARLGEEFARAGQQASPWRALLVAARAASELGDAARAAQYAARAREALGGLEARWGGEHYRSYLSRPDVRYYLPQLGAPAGV